MTLLKLGAISTGIIIVLSIALVIPAFTHKPDRQKIMLSFSLTDEVRSTEGCEILSSILTRHDVKATVFVSGSVAEHSSECIGRLAGNQNIDLGSRTYSYSELTKLDYTFALEEVNKGKAALDRAGGLDTRSFMAPLGSTDENIYSLLSRANITADFSYDIQYNKYHDGQFIRFNATSYQWNEKPVEYYLKLPPDNSPPIIIRFDESTPAERVTEFISVLSGDTDLKLVNASELTGLQLTVRRAI